MKCKYLVIILVLTLSISGCLDALEEGEKTSAESTTTKTYVPLVIDLSSNNLVMIDNDQMASKEKTTFDYMYAAINFVLPELIASDPACLTIADVGSGVAESVINDPTRCLKKVKKVKKEGDKRGFIIWEEESNSSNSTNNAPPLTVQKCGIIKTDGSVHEVDFGDCPKQNEGFKNSLSLNYVSDTKLSGLSNGGKYLEYDTSNDTETVIISDASGNIDMMVEIDHPNAKKYLYKVGLKAKHSINGVVTNIPELDGKYPHKVGTDIQFKEGNVFKRAYFDGSGDAIVYQYSNILYQASAVPVAFADWLLNGVGPNPQGPVINDSLNNCDSNKIGGTTVLLCPSGVYKYGDSTSDLYKLNRCSLGGNCGGSNEVISCVTNTHYYTSSPVYDPSINSYSILNLSKVDPINSTYDYIFNLTDFVSGLSESQVDEFKINYISCSGSTVTATTNTKTIVINNADSTPDISYLDIVAEEVI